MELIPPYSNEIKSTVQDHIASFRATAIPKLASNLTV